MKSERLRQLLRFGLSRSLGWKVFDILVFQKILGFAKQGLLIIDFLHPSQLEYILGSDIGNLLFFQGEFENKEISLILNQLRAFHDPVILDIGANIGVHSLAWAQALPNAKIFAFEPAPLTNQILQRNVTKNHLASRIEIIPAAVSDHAGTADFYECDDNAFSSLKNTNRKPVLKCIQVPVTTIDEFVAANNISSLTLIKIDVEGFETEVIKGALETLTTLKPDLFVEIYGGSDSNPNPDYTISLICSLGYRAFIIVDNQLVPFKSHSDQYYNYYFTYKYCGSLVSEVQGGVGA